MIADRSGHCTQLSSAIVRLINQFEQPFMEDLSESDSIDDFVDFCVDADCTGNYEENGSSERASSRPFFQSNREERAFQSTIGQRSRRKKGRLKLRKNESQPALI